MKCNTCKKEYDQLWSGVQGKSCCATVTENKKITPGFGSEYCLRRFKWSTGRPGHVYEGNFCDVCIKRRIEDGSLIEV